MNRFKMFAASLLVLFIIMQFGGNVFAKEEGMKLTVETRELTMDEIPKDRVVKLNVTAENLTEFSRLYVDVKFDDALTSEYHYFEINPEFNTELIAGTITLCDIDPNDFIGSINMKNPFRACVDSRDPNEKPVKVNGNLFTLNFVLPKEVKPGDFFEVKIVGELPVRRDGGMEKTELVVIPPEDPMGDWSYRSDFTELNEGGIRIVDKHGEDPIDTSTPAPTAAPATKGGTFEDFVERLYNVALNRDSEPEGKAFWCEHVGSGELTGAQCANEFLLSKEFNDRNLSNEEFLKVLYKTFFDRNAAEDKEGFNFWMNTLKTEGRDRVVSGFINSTEWCNICASYGVKSGAKYAKATIASADATAFAERLYTKCLGRSAEEDGLKFWSLGLTNLEFTGSGAAREFFYSAEFNGLGLDNKELITRMYRTFMGREPEDEGFNYWIDAMNKGMTKDQLFDNFAASKEFTDICNSYGIDK